MRVRELVLLPHTTGQGFGNISVFKYKKRFKIPGKNKKKFEIVYIKCQFWGLEIKIPFFKSVELYSTSIPYCRWVSLAFIRLNRGALPNEGYSFVISFKRYIVVFRGGPLTRSGYVSMVARYWSRRRSPGATQGYCWTRASLRNVTVHHVGGFLFS